MRLCLSLIFPDFISPPVNVQDDHDNTDSVLVGNFLVPGFVSFWPEYFIIICELGLISFFEITFPLFLFGLEGKVFMVPSPIVEIVVVEP